MSPLKKFPAFGVFAGAALAAVCLTGPAFARIQCDRQFQIVRGEKISTPFCEDAYLAQVAQSYGTKVSAEAIRQNPNTKARICIFLAADIRVSDICAGYRPEGDWR